MNTFWVQFTIHIVPMKTMVILLARIRFLVPPNYDSAMGSITLRKLTTIMLITIENTM